ncbi:hypothetical protein V6Z11_A07G220900 [Gossypium hirsutum]
MGPHTRVAHTSRLPLPVWPTRPGLKPTHPCKPIRPTWPSPCGLHGHTHTTTWPCHAHGHAFVYHTAVSRIRPTIRTTTCTCGADRTNFQLLPKFDFLRFEYTPDLFKMLQKLRAL